MSSSLGAPEGSWPPKGHCAISQFPLLLSKNCVPGVVAVRAPPQACATLGPVRASADWTGMTRKKAATHPSPEGHERGSLSTTMANVNRVHLINNKSNILLGNQRRQEGLAMSVRSVATRNGTEMCARGDVNDCVVRARQSWCTSTPTALLGRSTPMGHTALRLTPDRRARIRPGARGVRSQSAAPTHRTWHRAILTWVPPVRRAPWEGRSESPTDN